VTVVAKLSDNIPDVRLAVTDLSSNTVYSSSTSSVEKVVRLTITGLSANTEYTYRVESITEEVECPTGRFKTLPAASGTASSFTLAFGGDTSNSSNHAVFETILNTSPLMFIHLGDMHYSNIATNTQSLFHAAYDEIFYTARQSKLYREIPTAYVWDDHDYGPNNSHGSSTPHDAACATYRSRVPHYPLVDATVTAPIHQTWDIGRVRFILTDQRSAASTNATFDNSSKTMLGVAQKTWFKNLIQNSPGKVIVWICPRMFGGVTTSSADHWGGFNTERVELCDHIKTHAHGRVVVLSADAHALAIDDGTNHDFATGGGEPIPTFQAAPLDRGPDDVIYGDAQYSEGWFNNNGQWGSMEVTDTGTSSVGITWRGFDSTGTELVSHSFAVTV
jgi:phosphodiesterase/alkaline phosphatase D-like protein